MKLLSALFLCVASLSPGLASPFVIVAPTSTLSEIELTHTVTTITYSAVTNSATTQPACPYSTTVTKTVCHSHFFPFWCPRLPCIPQEVAVLVAPQTCSGLPDSTQTVTRTCKCGCPTVTEVVFQTDAPAS